MKSIPLEGRIWLLSLSSLPDRIQSLYVLSLRTPTLHFFSKLTCKNFPFLLFRDTALFFFPFLSGLKKPCVRTFPDARLLIFFSMFLCLFLMFSLVLRMNRIFWFLQRGLSKKCQRGVPKNINYSNSQIKSYYYTLLYRNYSSIWFYMCSTVQSPQTVLNGVINLLSHLCYQSKILVISWYRLTTR